MRENEKYNISDEKAALPHTGNSDFPVLNISAGTLSEIAANLPDREIFNYVNSLLKIIGPVIDQNNGHLANVDDSGLTAIFSDSCSDALKSAVTMYQYAAGGNTGDSLFKKLAVGISFGAVYTGNVGYGKFGTHLVISECTGFAKFLRGIAEKYNSHILITESVVNKIPSFFAGYNSRRLGKILHRKTNYAEFIYDVFDGDSIDVKNAKKRGKLFFETGVNMFLEGRYDVARSYFIELVKSYRNDSAAKEYLLLCDRCLSGKESEIRDYLEIW